MIARVYVCRLAMIRNERIATEPLTRRRMKRRMKRKIKNNEKNKEGRTKKNVGFKPL